MIIADGFDIGVLTAVRAALKAEGATTWVIAPRRGMIFPTGVDPESGTGGLMADHHLEGQRSTMFDAIFVCPGAQSTLTLREVDIHLFFFHIAGRPMANLLIERKSSPLGPRGLRPLKAHRRPR